jgi:hypothetical protein
MAPSVHQGWDPDRLRRHRERHGLTLDQVADAVRNLDVAGFVPPNATFQTVGRHERGESYPRPRYQRAYCELYGANEVALGFRAGLPAELTTAGQAAGQLPPPAGPALTGCADLDRPAGGSTGGGPHGRAGAAPRPPGGPGQPVSGRQAAGRLYQVDAEAGFARAARYLDDLDDLDDDLAPRRGGEDPPARGVEEAAARALASERLRGAAGRAAKAADASLADALAVILAAQRAAEDAKGSAPLLGPVTAQLAALMPLVIEARGPARRGMVDVAAQWAQFAGWLHANTGATAQAGVWLDRAAEWAAESENPSLAANVLSYKGHLAWEARAVGPLIGLSQAAQRVPDVYSGQRAYDASQEARGHAMAGDAASADRKLGEARELWQQARCDPDGPPPWSYYFSPSFARLQEGLAHRYLARGDCRRARLAAEYLTAGLDGLPEEQRGAEWAAEFVYHLAIAHLHLGEPEPACAATIRAAAIARATGSARVTSQVGGLHRRIVRRWPALPAVTELSDRLRDTGQQAR